MNTTEIEILNENVDYKYRDDIKKDTTAIEILDGVFAGTVFRFVTVNIVEDNGEASVRFTFDIIETRKNRSKDRLMKNTDFHNLLSNILNSILLSNLDGEEVNNDNNRKNNIEKSII